MSIQKQYQPRAARSFSSRAAGTAIVSDTFLKRVKLTAANIIAMYTTPVAILAAPGSTQALWVRSITFRITRTSTAFTGGGVVSFQYHTTTTSVPHSGTIPAAIVTGSAGTVQSVLGPYAGANALVLPAGEGIDITNGTQVFAAGTGTAEVFIEYSLLQF